MCTIGYVLYLAFDGFCVSILLFEVHENLQFWNIHIFRSKFGFSQSVYKFDCKKPEKIRLAIRRNMQLIILLTPTGSRRNSRIEFQTLPSNPRGDFKFSFDFRTTATEGVIFYASDELHRDVIAIYMKDGKVGFVSVSVSQLVYCLPVGQFLWACVFVTQSDFLCPFICRSVILLSVYQSDFRCLCICQSVSLSLSLS